MNTRNNDIGWLQTVAETLEAIKPGTQEAKMVEAWVDRNASDQRITELEAACAVMREALLNTKQQQDWSKNLGENWSCIWNAKVEKALSTDCGKDLLANYQQALELLRDYSGLSHKKWYDRRDTLLAKVKGGSNG